MGSKRYFDKVASQWDAMRAALFSDAVRDKAISAVGVKQGETAVDVGAGTGFIAEGLVKAGLKVIAVDQSPEMLKQMRQKFKAYADIDYRLGEAEKLPLDSGSVDCIFANMCLHHVEHPAAAVKEWMRVLKSGGRLAITDMDEHEFDFLIKEQKDRWKGFKRSDIRRWLLEAGLKNVFVGEAQET